MSGKVNPVDLTRYKGFKIQKEHLNGPLAEPINIKYIAFPSQSALGQETITRVKAQKRAKSYSGLQDKETDLGHCF